MDVLHLILFVLIIFTGSMIQNVSGFGFSIFVQAFFPYFMPSTSAGVAIAGMLSVTTSAYPAAKLRKHIKPKRVLIPLSAYICVSTFVISYFATKPDVLIKKLLAVVLILMSLYFIFIKGKIHVKPTVVNGLLAGALCGVLSGLFSIGGPPIVLYMLACCENNDEYFANSQAYFFCAGIYSFLMRLINGIIDWNIVTYFLIGVPVVFFGAFVGRKLVNKVKADKIIYLVYAVMIFSGIMMVISG